MKKLVGREYIKEMFDDDRELADYCTVKPLFNGCYGVVRDIDGIVLVMGKELKGYIGDIIYPQYDGYRYATGDYRLTSDRHGLICKWKDEKAEMLKSLIDAPIEEVFDKLWDAIEHIGESK